MNQSERDSTPRRPNVILIMADDLGFSDLGCYGAEIRTPHLDALAANGVRMSQFCNTARCSPARAALLTGLHPHQTGIGILTNDDGPAGYPGTLNDRCLTMAEVLRADGYETAMFGKWHLCGDIFEPNHAWPTRRGFDTFYGILAGACSYYQPVSLYRGESPESVSDSEYYLTTALGAQSAQWIRDHCAHQGADPFFLYLPFTAPHWPLHAPEDAVGRYRGTYDSGWDAVRERRYQRLIDLGLINGRWPLSERDEHVVPWHRTADKEWQARRMEVYAAQVELMDSAIGQVVEAVRQAGELDDTLIMFVSDNGGCAEEIPPAWVDELPVAPVHTPPRTIGGERVRRGNDTSVVPGPDTTYASYGRPWANVSNTPFREYKHWVHEGGIATPFIAHWPAGGVDAGINHDPHHLPDVLATVLEVTGATYPEEFPGRDPLPIEGRSMLASWLGESTPERPLFFEHEGNRAVRLGRWKCVSKYPGGWELYDLEADRTELHDVAGAHPSLVAEMADLWQQWADRCGVKPRDKILAAARSKTGSGAIVHVSGTFQSSHEITSE